MLRMMKHAAMVLLQRSGVVQNGYDMQILGGWRVSSSTARPPVTEPRAEY
jgi:hypothetical protein